MFKRRDVLGVNMIKENYSWEKSKKQRKKYRYNIFKM